MRVLIVDDEAPARDKLARWLGEQPDIEVVGQSDDGLAAAAAIALLRPDVAFLDIQMPGLSGLEVASQLEPDDAPLIVFVTAFDEHAIKAFDLDAVDYLLKPYDKDRLSKTLDRLRQRRAGGAGGGASAVAAAAVRTARAQLGTSDRLLVPERDSLKLIDAHAIHWIEADDNYVHVHTANARYLLRRTLTDLIAQLGEQRFARIHKSAAVNLAEVAELSPLFKGDHEVRLRNGATLRLSRRFKDALFARLRA